MNLHQKTRILGIAAVSVGILSALLCVVPYGFTIGLLTGFIGMILSSIYIFVDTRNEINTRRFTPGVLGMLLNSVPVLFVIVIILYNKLGR